MNLNKLNYDGLKLIEDKIKMLDELYYKELKNLDKELDIFHEIILKEKKIYSDYMEEIKNYIDKYKKVFNELYYLPEDIDINEYIEEKNINILDDYDTIKDFFDDYNTKKYTFDNYEPDIIYTLHENAPFLYTSEEIEIIKEYHTKLLERKEYLKSFKNFSQDLLNIDDRLNAFTDGLINKI